MNLLHRCHNFRTLTQRYRVPVLFFFKCYNASVWEHAEERAVQDRLLGELHRQSARRKRLKISFEIFKTSHLSIHVMGGVNIQSVAYKKYFPDIQIMPLYFWKHITFFNCPSNKKRTGVFL